MDTMKILLGATAALLFGALVMSWNNTQNDVARPQKSELDQIKAQITEIRIEQDRIQTNKEIIRLQASTPPPIVPSSESNELKAQLAEKERQLQEIQETKDKAVRDAKTSDQENVEFMKRDLEKGDKELRRARIISQALLVGKITQFVESAEVGGFVTIQVLMPEQIQTGTILAIRRNSGILGELKVTDVTPEGAVANPMPGFGSTKPQPGYELINPPPF
jgi:hypothetical protein